MQDISQHGKGSFRRLLTGHSNQGAAGSISKAHTAWTVARQANQGVEEVAGRLDFALPATSKGNVKSFFPKT